MFDLTKDELAQKLRQANYICDDEVVVTIYLALRLGKPLLVEGAAGVGKTEIGKVLSEILATDLIRLQCYEGLDETKALYEWNYQKQLIRIQLSQARGLRRTRGGDHDAGRDADDDAGDDGDARAVTEDDLFSEEYLLERPLLRAIRSERAPVLLIDEIDKTDEEFEAFLFELLSDFQISIPELGTIRARQTPVVVLTSNNERELSDGLKRRCIYLYLDYPSVEKETAIILAKVPGIGERLCQQVAVAVDKLRTGLDLKKKPAIAETLDWARALKALGASELSPEMIRNTLNLVLKTREDQETFYREMGPATLSSLVPPVEGRSLKAAGGAVAGA